jgi:hypothetical protein
MEWESRTILWFDGLIDEYITVTTTETREGWPLLTVETEVNGDAKVLPLQEIVGLPWLL